MSLYLYYGSEGVGIQTEDDGTDQTGEEQRRNEEVKTCGVVYTSIEVQPRQKYADDAAKQQKQD